MVKGLVVMAAALLAVRGAGQATPAVRPDHPRMFFNAETWPAVKARAEGAAKADLARLLKRCRAYPADPVCSGTGPLEFGDVKTASGTHKITEATPIKAVREWGSEAAECALAWRMTGDGALLQKAKKMIAVSADAYRESYRNGREVNWYSTTRILAFCAYDWIYEALTDGERRALIVPLVEHVLETQKPPRKIVRRNSGGIATGFYGVESLPWYAGLAAAGDGFCDEAAADLLRLGYARGMKLLQYRNDGAGDDGALSSAVPGYCLGAYPWAHFNFLHTALSAMGLDLAKDYPRLALFPNWIYWTWIPNAADPARPFYSGFGDSQHGQNEMPTGRLAEHLAQYVHFFGEINPALARLAASLRDRAPRAALGSVWPVYPFLLGTRPMAEPFPAAALENLPLKARHFETLGQVVMRSGWTPESTFCTFTAGATLRQHKHHDENNFVIYRKDFLALDSGTRGIETDWNLKYYYAQTVAHNCVLILRPDEPLPSYWGPRYTGPEGQVNHGGQYNDEMAKVLAFETCEAYSYVASDATACYGRKCTEAVRQFIHLQPDVFVVYDRVGAATASDRKAWLLHTANEPALAGATLRADCGQGRLFCETVFPPDARIEKIGGPERRFWSAGKNWEVDQRYLASAAREAARTGRGPYFGAWRLEVSPAAAAADDRFLHVLTAADVGQAAGAVTRRLRDDTRDGVALTVPEIVRDGVKGRLDATVWFNRAGTVGGAIEIVFAPADGSAPRRVGRALSQTVLPQEGLADASLK
ncbi:MAG: heparinase II/III family protein [Kiritimatiellia bacterium]